MRTTAQSLSYNFRGARPTEWAGAVNPLPSDFPIGSHELTLTNVVVNSRVHIESQDGTAQYYDAVAASSTVTVTLDVFAPGQASNDWRIRVRKGSVTPFYIPYETLMTATVGSSSIFVSQISDE